MEVLEGAVPRKRFPLAALYISSCPGAASTRGFPAEAVNAALAEALGLAGALLPSLNAQG